ncbi:MAG: hypothetical protein KF743_12300 [Fimbriimonadaceae bacterium]|nr:hypothetical protein [Fimbriimonadaceae bacterium]
MSRHIYKVGRTEVTLGLDRPLRQLFGLVRETCTPNSLSTGNIPVTKEGLERLFDLADKHGRVPKSCRDALQVEVTQFLAGVHSHNVVVLHRSDSEAKHRLEELRTELRRECISYGELAELESLRPNIEPDDVELLGAMGEQE